MFKLLPSKRKQIQYGWSGNYSSWNEAAAVAAGYDSAHILEKTRDALLKIKDGIAAYERDSVVFYEKEYPFPLISCILRSAALLRRPLNILDFGGSLGSTYYQVKDFIGTESCASWNIVEQEHYVSCGKENFEDDHLKFYFSIAACLEEKSIDLIVVSSTAQYLPAPHQFLEQLAAYNFDFIVFDRTAFHDGTQDRLTLQVVPPEIYEASYPSWFFNTAGFLSHFNSNYKTICELPPYVKEEAVMLIDNQPAGFNKGFYFINNALYAQILYFI
jgi:putative methyltransferase (TIGR04325 family)